MGANLRRQAPIDGLVPQSHPESKAVGAAQGPAAPKLYARTAEGCEIRAVTRETEL